MAQIHKRQFTLNNFYGEEVRLISLLGGKQTFVFYTIRNATSNKVGMFEVLINEKLADNEQLVIDYGEMTIATPDDLNYGPIHLGSGAGKLLTLRNNFTKIKGYTICNYREVVGDVGSTECAPLDVGQYSLDPFQTDSTHCKKE